MSQHAKRFFLRCPHRAENVARLFDVLWPVGALFCGGPGSAEHCESEYASAKRHLTFLVD